MDRSLDEILAEKRSGSSSRSNNHRGGGRGRRDRTENFPRDGVRKSYRDESRNLDKDWLHDKFEAAAPRRSNNRRRRDSPEASNELQGAKLRVDNIHYELTEDDLDELFNRIGRVLRLDLRYDRAGRSEGTAFVTYESRDDAREAIKQFDGANANGQPIRLTLIPAGPPARGPQRNPFDTAVMPGRPLEERITRPGDSGGSSSRPRSVSPDRDIDEAAKKGIDRYVPGGMRSRSSANPPSRRREGRRPGARRDGDTSRGGGGGSRGGNDSEDGRGGGGRRGGGGGNPRPKKTAEELDAEMADYFGNGGESKAADIVPPPADTTIGHIDDVDMVE